MVSDEQRNAQVESVGPGHDRVVGAGGRRAALRRDLVFGVWQQDLPAAGRGLQRVEVKGDEVVEEEAFNLATEDVDFGAQDVQCMSVAACWAGALWQCARPVLGRCEGQQMQGKVQRGAYMC